MSSAGNRNKCDPEQQRSTGLFALHRLKRPQCLKKGTTLPDVADLWGGWPRRAGGVGTPVGRWRLPLLLRHLFSSSYCRLESSRLAGRSMALIHKYDSTRRWRGPLKWRLLGPGTAIIENVSKSAEEKFQWDYRPSNTDRRTERVSVPSTKSLTSIS